MPSVSSETMLLCIRSDRFRAPGGNCVGHGAGAKCWVVKAGLVCTPLGMSGTLYRTM